MNKTLTNNIIDNDSDNDSEITYEPVSEKPSSINRLVKIDKEKTQSDEKKLLIVENNSIFGDLYDNISNIFKTEVSPVNENTQILIMADINKELKNVKNNINKILSQNISIAKQIAKCLKKYEKYFESLKNNKIIKNIEKNLKLIYKIEIEINEKSYFSEKSFLNSSLDKQKVDIIYHIDNIEYYLELL